jgi:phage tail sheath protein FI
MEKADKANAETRAANCLRELEARGDIVRNAAAGSVPSPAVPQWKYVSVKRMSLYLESSLKEGIQWAVFEPNGPALWSQIRLSVGDFMQALFVQGAFQGTAPQQAYFVKCDAETTTQSNIDQGIVNIAVGFAPLYPAEFVTIQISQMTSNPKPPKLAK